MMTTDIISPETNEKAMPYHFADAIDAPALPLPDGLRSAFGWRYGSVPLTESGNRAVLGFPRLGKYLPARLRLTTAIDIREERILRLVGAKSGQELGVLDVRYSSPLQPVETLLSAAATQIACEEGIALTVTTGKLPHHFLHTPDPNAPAFRPHLLVGDAPVGRTRADALLDRLFSSGSLQLFGWMEGCVLDGLFDLQALPQHQNRASAALRTHLRAYLQPNGDLVYEAPGSRAVINQMYGIEIGLPFAVLAKTEPKQPILDIATRFWQDMATKRTDELITESSVTTEGMLTIGYPLAVLAHVRDDRTLAALAAKQLTLRGAMLSDAEAVYQHNTIGQRPTTYRNWARGVAWYLLGIVRSLPYLANRPQESAALTAECTRVVAIALRHQRADGLWRNYLDDDKTGVDTSGSAGIAAALALGHRAKILTATALEAARRARTAIETNHLTPDGYISGVAQMNKGGESLQRGEWRGMSPYTLGLYGQLIAALDAPP